MLALLALDLAFHPMVDFRVPRLSLFRVSTDRATCKQRKIVGSGRKAHAKLDFLARSPSLGVRREGIEKEKKNRPKLNPSDELVSKEGQRDI